MGVAWRQMWIYPVFGNVKYVKLFFGRNLQLLGFITRLFNPMCHIVRLPIVAYPVQMLG